MSESATIGRAQTEVGELHQFFQAWFRAELPPDEASFQRFSDVMAPTFEMVVPDGSIRTRSELMETLPKAHGQWRDDPDARIEIHHHRADAVAPGIFLVVYDEWQFAHGRANGRRSTALLLQHPVAHNGLQWLHVHETGLPLDRRA